MNSLTFEQYTDIAENISPSEFILSDFAKMTQQLVNSKAIDNKIKAEFKRCIQRKRFDYFASIKLDIFSANGLNISLSHLDSKSNGERYLIPAAMDSYIAIYGCDAFPINYYELSPCKKRLQLDKELVLTSGDVCQINKGQYFGFPNMKFDDVLILCIAKQDDSTVNDSVLTKFDAKTLEASYSNSADFKHTRAQYMAEILGAMGNRQSIEPLAKLCKYDAHFVRWSALESLINVDYEMGIKTLYHFLNDPHPHIQKGAQQALKMFTLPETA